MDTPPQSLFFEMTPAPPSFIACGRPRTFSPHEIILSAHSNPDGCFYITDGLVFTENVSENGNTAFGLAIKRNVTIGSSSLLLNAPARVNFRAQEQTRALFISAQDFDDLFRNDPAVSQYVAILIAKEMFAIRKVHRNRSRETLMWRLCNVLAEFSAEYGKPVGSGMLIDFSLSHQILANFAGANRVNITKCMQTLKQAGIAYRLNDLYFIPDMKRFRRYMDAHASDSASHPHP